MFYTMGLEESLRNLVTLATPFTSTGSIASAEDLESAVSRYLGSLNGGSAPARRFHVLTETSTVQEVSRLFQLPTVSPDPDWSTEIIGGERERALFEAAFATLDDQLQFLLRLLFTDIALLNGEHIKPGSGAVYTRPGLVYFSPRKDWSTQDLAECFVHEATHLLLHWDAACHKHYQDEARTARMGSFARTAITGTPRNGQVVFHSLIVAAEIAALRRASFDNADGVHGTARGLRESAVSCAEDLLSRTDLTEHYTSRAIALMERALAQLTVEG